MIIVVLKRPFFLIFIYGVANLIGLRGCTLPIHRLCSVGICVTLVSLGGGGKNPIQQLCLLIRLNFIFIFCFEVAV